MENAVSKHHQRDKVSKMTALSTRMPLAAKENLQQGEATKPAGKTRQTRTKTQPASKAARKEELDIRPRLAPIHNTRASKLSKVPPPIKPPTIARPLKGTAIEGGERLMKKEQVGRTAKPTVETTEREEASRSTQQLCLALNSQQLEDKAVTHAVDKTATVREIVLQHPQLAVDEDIHIICFTCQRSADKFHSLAPDHITNLDSLPWDTNELRDPQQCTEYVGDIYEHLLEMERKAVYKTTPSMLTQQSEVQERHRGVLVDWLVQVHLKFHLLPETLHACIDIVDRYLQVS
jgi:hypothetical protein